MIILSIIDDQTSSQCTLVLMCPKRIKKGVILKDMFPTKCAICGQMIDHPTEANFFPKAQLVTHQVCFVELTHKCLSPPLDPAVFDIFRTLGLIYDEQDDQEHEVIIH